MGIFSSSDGYKGSKTSMNFLTPMEIIKIRLINKQEDLEKEKKKQEKYLDIQKLK